MIRDCTSADFAAIHAVINEAAASYQGVIPADRWHEPYMAEDELRGELAAGVAFLGYEREGELAGVMGIQPFADVVLIRHAYVRPTSQRRGIGGHLLAAARERARAPVLVGTWAAAVGAVSFYERHGFRVVCEADKAALLRNYWTVPERQIQTSVVLAEAAWFETR